MLKFRKIHPSSPLDRFSTCVKMVNLTSPEKAIRPSPIWNTQKACSFLTSIIIYSQRISKRKQKKWLLMRNAPDSATLEKCRYRSSYMYSCWQAAILIDKFGSYTEEGRNIGKQSQTLKCKSIVAIYIFRLQIYIIIF